MCVCFRKKRRVSCDSLTGGGTPPRFQKRNMGSEQGCQYEGESENSIIEFPVGGGVPSRSQTKQPE